MVGIEVVYEGELHTRSRHLPSDSELETDAPVDNEGRGERFSPTDLVASALASCMLTVMGIVARRREVAIEGARASVEKHMSTGPGRRIARLVVNFAMPAGIAEGDRSVLERAAHACPVHRSLHPDVETDIRFEWA